MGKLVELHNEILKEAEANEAQQERVNILVKYAAYAESLLEEKYGDDYNAEDVEKLAEALIDNDIAAEAYAEKVAEYGELGREMARNFVAELEETQKEEA